MYKSTKSDRLGRRSKSTNKKATAFIKIVRSPTQNASSLFRSRRATSLFSKIIFITCIAYALYILNHPSNGSMERQARDISNQQKPQVVQDSKGKILFSLFLFFLKFFLASPEIITELAVFNLIITLKLTKYHLIL